MCVALSCFPPPSVCAKDISSGRRGREGVRLDFASEVPVPESTSPLKRGGEAAQGGSPSKHGPGRGDGDGRQVTLDMQQLAALLEETGQKIMKAQHDHVEARMGALEELTGKRLASAETRIGTVEHKVESMEEKLDALAKKLEATQTTGPGSDHQDRRFTLVYGGWPRDSRRDDILHQLQKALDRLGVWDMVDYPPFTTGPRRSTALSVFAPRGDESAYQVKKRMHSIIRAVTENEVTLPGGRRLFATYAKSKGERAIGAHAAWVKRAVLQVCPGEGQRLDMEYQTGGVWTGSSFVASAKQPCPAGAPDNEVVWDDHKEGKYWVQAGALARELGITMEEIKRGLEEAKR